MEPTEQPPFAAPDPPSRQNRKKWMTLAAVATVIVVTVVLIWIVNRNDKNPQSDRRPQATTKPAPVSTSTPKFTSTTIAQGRAHIWEIAFLPSRDILFTERNGSISALTPSGQIVQVAQIPDVYASGEGGLMGLAVDPKFAENRYIYTCYNSTANDIRIVRSRVAEDQKSLQNQQVIVTVIALDKSIYLGRHAGCRIAFGPDGYLWAGTGDNAQGDTSIQPMNLGGKILRVDREGKAAPDNMGGQFDARIYSYGHRNIQGLAFFAVQKHGVWGVSTEHGSTVDDEVNELRKGNFGWAPAPGGYDEKVPMTDTARFPDAVSAIWSSGDPTQAPSGIAVVKGKAWEGWNGALAMAMLKGKHLKILRLDAENKVIKEERVLEGTFGRLRGITMGPDGSLYVSSSNGNDDKVIKLTPTQQ